MNWYKKSKYSLEIMLKEAGIFDKAIWAEISILLPLLSYLGWSKADLFNSLEKNNNDTNAVKKEIIEEAEQQNVPEQIVQQIQQTEPEPKSAPEPLFPYDSFRQRLIAREGFTTKANPIGRKGEIDIGIGHAMYNPNNPNPTAVSRRIFSKLFDNSVNFDAVLSGQQELTEEQANMLANYDIDLHLNRARRMFPRFDTYPGYLQEALLDSVYRGDTGSKTTRLINQNNWTAAAKEYLNRYDYRNAKRLGIPGIKLRMESNRDAMLQYAKELG